jgi:hypothetical protein
MTDNDLQERDKTTAAKNHGKESRQRITAKNYDNYDAQTQKESLNNGI